MQCSYVRYVASAASRPSRTWIHTAARDVTIPLQQNWDPSVWNAESAKWKTARQTARKTSISDRTSWRHGRHPPSFPQEHGAIALRWNMTSSTLQHIKINVEPWGESTLLYPLEVFRSIQILRPQKKKQDIPRPQGNHRFFYGILWIHAFSPWI